MPKKQITLEVEIPDGWEPCGNVTGIVGRGNVEAVINYTFGWSEKPDDIGMPFRRVPPPYQPIKVQGVRLADAPWAQDGEPFLALIYGSAVLVYWSRQKQLYQNQYDGSTVRMFPDTPVARVELVPSREE